MQTDAIELHFYSAAFDSVAAAQTAEALSTFINGNRRKFGLNAFDAALSLVSFIEHALAEMGSLDLAVEFYEEVTREFNLLPASGSLYATLAFGIGMYDVLYPEGWDVTADSTMKGLGRAFNVCSNLLINVAQQLWGHGADKKMSEILHDVADKTLMKIAAQRGPVN